ncbi:hypothetical protein TNCV_4507501 [Trichonephila clavipes]|nr:hypothetical protein TNCV_4507501 [Trichonephila clavipes]
MVFVHYSPSRYKHHLNGSAKTGKMLSTLSKCRKLEKGINSMPLDFIERENTLRKGSQGPSTSLPFPTNLTRRLAARWLLRVPPSRKGTMHFYYQNGFILKQEQARWAATYVLAGRMLETPDLQQGYQTQRLT